VTLIAVLAVVAVGAAPASAAGEPKRMDQRGAFYCAATIWKSGLWKKAPLLKRFDNILAIADKVDKVTDMAALALAAMSLSTLAAPSAVVKLVAKLGKAGLKKVVQTLAKATRATKNKKVGVRVKISCLWGAIPYPGVGIYT